MDTDGKLRSKIMWRVRAVYCVRCAMHPLTKWAGLVAALAVVVSSVSVTNIAINTLSVVGKPLALTRFFLDALITTELTTQIFSLLAVACFVFVAYDTIVRLKEFGFHRPVKQ